MLNDFKNFIARGNLLDLAIGFIMGAAFSTVVKSFTEGIIMPIVGLATGGFDFSKMYYDLSGVYQGADKLQEAIDKSAPLIMYGQFITDLITFLIVGIVMFFLARWAMSLFKGLEGAPDGPGAEETLLTEIRDILKDKK